MPIHASLIGWTADGHWFGFCGAYGAAMAETRCSEATVDGTARAVDQASRRAQLPTPTDTRPPTWRYGGVLRLTWEIQPPAYLDDGPPHRPAAFVLSGGELGDTPTYVLDRLVVAPGDPDLELHVDAISPSADGSALGAVIHCYSGEWTDTYHLLTWSTDDLASRTLDAISQTHQE